MKYTDPTGLDVSYYDKAGKKVDSVPSEEDKVYLRETSTESFEGRERQVKKDTLLEDNQGNALTNQQFEDLLGTVYAEMTPGSDSWEEGAAIYSVMENRANADGVSTYAVASNESAYGVYGWREKGKYNDPGAPPEQKQAAFTGVINGILKGKDYSNGAFFWHGSDLGQSGTPAYRDYYLTGLDFTNSKHNIWNLAPRKSGTTAYDYKFQTTAAFRNTTFMRLTDTWKKAMKSKKWNGR